MIETLRACRLMMALVAFLPTGVAAQFQIEAPGGVAAKDINRSKIFNGLSAADQRLMEDVYWRRVEVSIEARVKAEAHANELAVRLDVTREVVISFFRIVGEQDVPPAQIAVKLGEIATKYQSLKDRWSVLDMTDPATAVLATQAKAAVEAGRYDEADAALVRARDRQIATLQQAEQLAREALQAIESRRLSIAETDGKRGDLAMTRLRYVDAAQLYAAAASNVPSTRQDERRKYLEKEAVALFEQGHERGDNRTAALAIDRYRALVAVTDRLVVPLDWARTQNGLGLALWSLGEREAGTERLEEAVAVYRLALKEQTYERAPLGWAKVQVNLGNALVRIGERESGTERLDEGVVAYRLALQEMTREREPFGWALVQMNLALALARLGEREGGTWRLEEGVAASRLALQEWTRERVPLNWALVQINLGNALTRLGEREAGTGRLEEAVAVLRLALQETTRERAPMQWAMAQMNLGGALWRLGEREAGTERLENGV